MGANQDSAEIAFQLSIRNSRNFEYSSHGTMAGMAKDACTRMNFFEKLHNFCNSNKINIMNAEERKSCYTTMADEAFDET